MRRLPVALWFWSVAACAAACQGEVASAPGHDGGSVDATQTPAYPVVPADDESDAGSLGSAGNDMHGVGDGGAPSAADAQPSAEAGSSCTGEECSHPSSCRAGGEGVGQCGAAADSCCTSLEVPGGTYDRSYMNTGSGPTDAGDPATVSAFRLDKYMVTVGRFRQFVSAWKGGYLPPAGSGKHAHLNEGQGLASSAAPGTYETGWDASWNAEIAPTDTNLDSSSCPSTTWTASAGANESLPINCVTWPEAYAFCIWDGGFLPSEAEYEYAAAGGSQERQYPWGATDPGTANQYAIYDCNYPGGLLSVVHLCQVAPVGTATLGAGMWGQLDLGGELWEWNLDVWAGAYVTPCTDCAILSGDCACHTLRGGDAVSTAEMLAPERTTAQSNPSTELEPTDQRTDGVGFRCARVP